MIMRMTAMVKVYSQQLRVSRCALIVVTFVRTVQMRWVWLLIMVIYP
jgi:hypothetical protein